MEKEFKKEWLDVEILDDFQAELLAFANREKRAPSIQEMRWMRMRRACRKLAVQRQEYAMAAAKDGFNESIERSVAGTKVFSFTGNGFRVTIKVTEMPNEQPEVAVKMEDDDGNAVPHGRVIFPGVDMCFEADDNGWIIIPYADYTKYIQSVMRLQCSTSSSEPMDLIMQ